MTSKQEYKNENLTIELTKEPGCRATMDVTVAPIASEAAYRKAIKRVNKEVSLPGFRKGKAPENIIEQKYSKYIEQEWHDLLVQTTFKESLDLANVYPFNEKSVDRPQLKKSSRDEGSHIIFSMEVSPQIPEVDISSITLTPPKRKEVTEEKIDDAIMDLRIDKATWNEVKDRAIQDEDYIRVDIDNLDNPDHPICKDTHLFVKKGKIGNWMYDLLIGKKAGDVVEGTSQREDELSDADSFIETRVRITIHKIEQPDLPELSDEFVAKFGLKSAEELRKKVEEDLNKQSDELVRENLRTQMEEALFQKYPFDVPHSLFEGEKKSRLARLAELKKQLSPQEYEKAAAQYEDEKLNASVLRTLCLYFLKRKVAMDHKIDVTQEEIMQEMMWHLYNPNSNFLDPSMDPEQIRSKVYMHLMNKKTNDFLVDGANLADPS